MEDVETCRRYEVSGGVRSHQAGGGHPRQVSFTACISLGHQVARSPIRYDDPSVAPSGFMIGGVPTGVIEERDPEKRPTPACGLWHVIRS